MVDFSCFKIETENIHLASCSHSPLHRGISSAMHQYLADLAEYGNPWELWMQKTVEFKGLAAKLINASPEEISPHFSVSSALGSLLSSFSYDSRNEFLTSDMEYPTTNYVMLGQEKRGARVVTIRNRDLAVPISEYRNHAGPKTRLISAVHVSSLNGYRQDIDEISRISHDAGSDIYVDAYQSLGNIQVDVRKSDIDYLSGGTLKYLLGVPGLAFLYVRKDLIDSLEPTYIGWFSQKDPFKFGPTSLEYTESADRFQSGTLSVPSVYAAIEGLKIILEIGVTNIERRIRELTRRGIDHGRDNGLESMSPDFDDERGAIVSFLVKNPHELENKLRDEGIITSSRGAGLRLAPHFFNTEDEIERAVERIAQLNS